jgi:2-deoxy-D-gluconate 3-dehydrogenase
MKIPLVQVDLCLGIDCVQIFAINLKASFVAAQEVGRRLLQLSRPGKIINIASIISFIGNINISPYAATKGGVLQMTKAMSNEWASKGIQVNCICPG